MNNTQLAPEILEFLASQQTQSFLKAARSFIDILEVELIETADYFKKVHRSLIELYLAGHNLERIQIIYSDGDWDYSEVSKNVVYKNVGKMSELGKDAVYWENFDPTEQTELYQNSLVQDIDEIYEDIKFELGKIDVIGTNTAVEDALLCLQWKFTEHWGKHCIHALKVMHYVLHPYGPHS